VSCPLGHSHFLCKLSRMTTWPSPAARQSTSANLLRAGLPVPPGFCVTTDAYALATRGADLEPLLDELAGVPPHDRSRQATLAALICERILGVTVPADVADAVREALQAFSPNGAIAVRSSATAEDLPSASFAGQQDTYLNVYGIDAVVDAVRRCWASLWTDRAVTYRATNSIDPRAVRLAVVVQRLVNASIAGVLFSAKPTYGQAWGGGDRCQPGPWRGRGLRCGQPRPLRR
jgi:phosphoenolpyruvate synthase/pyruvate phosphate dikinase